MIDYNGIAQSNAEKGWYLFPVQQNKIPYAGFEWPELSSNDVQQIADWMFEYPDCRWAIDLKKSGKTVVDFDQHPDKPNGFETAKELGLTTDALVTGTSISGTGQHNWYDGTYPNSNGMYPGIDRKSAGGYIVAPYELPEPDDIYQPVPKEYQKLPDRRDFGVKWEGTVQAWLDSYYGMQISPEVQEEYLKLIGGFSGDAKLYGVLCTMVRYALEGKGGVPETLEQLEKLWITTPHNSGDPQKEWRHTLANVITKNGGGIAERTQEDVNEELEKLVERKKLNREADAIVDGMYHQSGETIDLDAPDEQSKHLIKDLIVEGGINVLFGNSNVGKSFMYMDMWASACMFGEWQGFRARPFKAMFVLGEGAFEFKKRLKVWCEYRGVNYDDIKKYAIVRDGGVISNVEERKIWKQIVDSEKVEAIIWDTWAATAGVENEDQAPQVTKTINAVRELGYHLTHLFIHHPPLSKENEEQQRLRGSGALTGRADSVINLADDSKNFSNDTVTPAEGTTWMRLSTLKEYGGKKRNGRKVTKQGLYFIERPYGTDEFGDQETSLVVDSVISGTSPAVVDVTNVLADKAMTIKQFTDEWNHFHPTNVISEHTGRRKLKDAVKSGRVVETKDPDSARGKLYKVNPVKPIVDFSAAAKVATISY